MTLANRLLQWTYVLLISFIFFRVYSYSFDEKVDMNGDDVAYFILGTSLANGTGFTSIHEVGSPPHNHFPPGYPAFISGIIKVFGPDILIVKRTNGLLLLASALILFFFAKQVTKNLHLSFTVVLLTILNPSLLRFSTITMSEVPFVFFSLLAFWLVAKMDVEKKWYKNPLFYVTVVLVAYAYHVRTAGISILAGLSLYFLFKRKWGYAIAYVVGFVLLAMPWYMRGKALGGSAYLGQLIRKNPYRPELGTMELTDWFVRFYDNFIRYLTREIPFGLARFPSFNYKTPMTWQEPVVGVLILAVVVFGLVKIKQYRTLILGYMLGSFGILLLWPSVWVGPRFVMPLIPLVIMLFCIGIYSLLNYLLSLYNVKNMYVSAAFAFVPLVSIVLLKPEVEKVHNVAKNKYREQYMNYIQLAKYAGQNIKRDEVVCCRKGQLFYLFSHRQTTNFRSTLDAEELLADLEGKSVDYVVVDQLGYSSTSRYLVPAIRKYPEKFKLVEKLGKPETYLFQFTPEIGYKGAFDTENKRSGQGEFKWANGDYFIGEWKDGLRNGKGKLIKSNGMIFEGTWLNDKLNGEVTLTNTEGGTVGRFIYENDVAVRPL